MSRFKFEKRRTLLCDKYGEMGKLVFSAFREERKRINSRDREGISEKSTLRLASRWLKRWKKRVANDKLPWEIVKATSIFCEEITSEAISHLGKWASPAAEEAIARHIIDGLGDIPVENLYKITGRKPPEEHPKQKKKKDSSVKIVQAQEPKPEQAPPQKPPEKILAVATPPPMETQPIQPAICEEIPDEESDGHCCVCRVEVSHQEVIRVGGKNYCPKHGATLLK